MMLVGVALTRHTVNNKYLNHFNVYEKGVRKEHYSLKK